MKKKYTRPVLTRSLAPVPTEILLYFSEKAGSTGLDGGPFFFPARHGSASVFSCFQGASAPGAAKARASSCTGQVTIPLPSRGIVTPEGYEGGCGHPPLRFFLWAVCGPVARADVGICPYGSFSRRPSTGQKKHGPVTRTRPCSVSGPGFHSPFCVSRGSGAEGLLLKHLRRQGPGEEEALDVGAAKIPQKFKLLLGLHALGYHGHLQVPGDLQD